MLDEQNFSNSYLYDWDEIQLRHVAYPHLLPSIHWGKLRDFIRNLCLYLSDWITRLVCCLNIRSRTNSLRIRSDYRFIMGLVEAAKHFGLMLLEILWMSLFVSLPKRAGISIENPYCQLNTLWWSWNQAKWWHLGRQQELVFWNVL